MYEINTLDFTTGDEMLSLAEKIKKYDTNALIELLKRVDSRLVKEDFEIIINKGITGQKFLELNEQILREFGMKDGAAACLAFVINFIKEKERISSSETRIYYGLMELVKNKLNLNDKQMMIFKENVQELEKNYEIETIESVKSAYDLHFLDMRSDSQMNSSLDRSIEMVTNFLPTLKSIVETYQRTINDDEDEEYPTEEDNALATNNDQEDRMRELVEDISNYVPNKNFWCSICGNGYAYKSGLHKHKRKKHPNL